jgi:hypothetical protein
LLLTILVAAFAKYIEEQDRSLPRVVEIFVRGPEILSFGHRKRHLRVAPAE